MDVEFLINGSRRVVLLEKKNGRWLIRREGAAFEADVRRLADGSLSVLVGSRSYVVCVAPAGRRVLVAVRGDAFTLEPVSETAPARPESAEETIRKESGLVLAPMPGRVVKVAVAESERVRRNQTLVILEAMKMENEIRSPRDASVVRIFVAAGDLVDADKPLLELEAGT